MNNILVIGASGFIGTQLCNKLNEFGYNVYASFSSKKSYEIFSRKTQINVHKIIGNIKEYDFCEKALENMDCVFNLAAVISGDRVEQFNSNILGFYNIGEAAIKNNVKKVFYCSSAIVYGSNNCEYQSEVNNSSLGNFYSVSKYIDEIIADFYNRTSSVEFVGLRFFNVYGNDNILSWDVTCAFFRSALRNEQIYIDNKNANRDFIYVDDVTEICLKLIDTTIDKNERIINIGTGTKTFLLDLATLIKQICHSTSNVIVLEKQIPIMNSCADLTRLNVSA